MRISLVFVVVLAGCSSPAPQRTGDPLIDLRSSDPVIVQYACNVVRGTQNLEAVPVLIENLRHREATIRLWTLEALIDLLRLTEKEVVGFGYGWADPEPKREKAVQRWEEWYEKVGRAHITQEIERRRQGAKVVTPEKASSTGAHK